MRWAGLLLLFANLGLAGYLMLVAPGQRGTHDPRALELNADKVKQVRDPADPRAAEAGACLDAVAGDV